MFSTRFVFSPNRSVIFIQSKKILSLENRFLTKIMENYKTNITNQIANEKFYYINKYSFSSFRGSHKERLYELKNGEVNIKHKIEIHKNLF